jgi:hypothetical protein
VGAASLDEGVAWCEATLGVLPGPGGEHPLMGTHNRLLRVATVDYPRAYCEIIAVQPGRSPQRPRRWFVLDDEAVRDRLRREGPRLLHFVASVDQVGVEAARWSELGIERGEVLAASRMSPRGLLQWQITVRPDGQRLHGGVLPTLIEWGDMHPAAAMPESGVTLQALSASHPQAERVRAAYDAIGLGAVAVRSGPPDLSAVLETPRGRVTLASDGL